MKNQPGTMKIQPGTMKKHEKPAWNHEKPWKPTWDLKNQDGTMKNIQNPPGTIKKTNMDPWKAVKKKPPRAMKNNEKPTWNHEKPTVTSQTSGPNRPPVLQKRDLIITGPQPTPFDAKTWHDEHGAPTDHLDV